MRDKFFFSVFHDLLSGSLNQYAKLILHKKLLYNIKYFDEQKSFAVWSNRDIFAFHRYKLLQMTNSETIYRHKLSRSVYFDKIGWHKLSHRRPKNAKTDKLSVSESFFPLGILKCAFYFLEAFFHCQQYMNFVSVNDWFLRGKFKGT